METTSAPLWPISKIHIGERHRKDLGDIRALAASIALVGLLHPVVVRPDGQLIAGERRLRALERLGWEEIPVHVVPLEEIVRGELHENTQRKAFAPSEWVAIEQAVRPEQEREARQRQVAHGGTAPGRPRDTSANFAEVSRGRMRDKVADYVGISGWTLEKAESVVAAAATEPARFQPLVEEMDRTGKVNGAYKKLRRAQEAERINREPPPLPTGPFRVIVADPPWRYENRPDDPGHRAAVPYPDLDIDAICALAVGELAAPDAVLWLWTTNAHLREAFRVVESWGFAYKTMLTWIKDRMGTGDWLRGQTEHCLLAIRGRPTLLLTNQTTALHAPLGAHSAKPAAFYEFVEGLCPGSKVDLFARQVRAGWSGWGGGFHANPLE